MAEVIIKFDNVGLEYNNKKVLDGASFEIYKGEIVTVAGPSGSGKSTILKLISGLIEPDEGNIIVNAKRFGMAFQSGALFNSFTVEENIALALKETTKLSEEEIAKRVKDSLETVDLLGTENLYPEELSGGMQKRVSIARALALQPEILLYDEPSTGLDPATASKLEEDMVKLKNKINVTSVVVTHDMATAKNVSDRILILDKGKIVWQGTTQQFLTDNSPYPYSFRERKALDL